MAWFKRYPIPRKIICDNGKTFISKTFKELCGGYGIKISNITTYNPTSNSICERLHLTLGNVLRICCNHNLDYILAEAGDLLRSTYHTQLEETPMKLVLNREKFDLLKGNIDTNLTETVRRSIEKTEIKSDKNLEKTNSGRIEYCYRKGDQVLIKPEKNMTGKYEEKFYGPYEVIEISHSKNSLYIKKEKGVEKINIKRVKPFRGVRCNDMMKY